MASIANTPKNIQAMQADEEIRALAKRLYFLMGKYNYPLNFTWLGRPIVQLPSDIVALQELIWEVKPDLVIETGIAHGGSLVLSASILELIGGQGRVLGIDIDIRQHNRVAIEAHPMFKRISMIEGSSVNEAVIKEVGTAAERAEKVMVILDSNHTHDHVALELANYSRFVTKGSYLVVLDTNIEDMPEESFPDRPWGVGNNPKTAVWEFMKSTDRFEIDHEFEGKLMLTTAPDGFLRCIKD